MASCWLTIAASGQDYNYVQYGTRDGLAGSTVYDMCQDKEGFIWFATENGLCRYDGTRFKTFTVKDGLPDNEVLLLHADKKGRVWVGTFTKELCYVKEGRVFRSADDSMLLKLPLKGFVSFFWEDRLGNLYIGDRHHLYKIKATGLVEDIAEDKAIRQKLPATLHPEFHDNDVDLRLMINDSLFSYKNGALAFLMKGPNKSLRSRIRSEFGATNEGWIELPDKNILNRVTFYRGRTVFASTTAGAFSIDTLRRKLGEAFLTNYSVTNTFIDLEGNTWFSTLGSGVFKLPSKSFKTISFDADNRRVRNEVFSIGAIGADLLVGLGFSRFAMLNRLGSITTVDLANQAAISKNNYASNRLLAVSASSSSEGILGFDAFLVKFSKPHKFSFVEEQSAIKALSKDTAGNLLVASAGGVLKVSPASLQVIDTLYRQRATTVGVFKNKVYIGTIQGLFTVDTVGNFYSLGKLSPYFSRRIVGLAVWRNLLWVATSDSGVIAFDERAVITNLSFGTNLQGTACKSIFSSDSGLWLGTNSGLTKITYASNRYNTINYTIADGLPSNDINAIFVTDSLVYVGTPAGLTFFDERKLTSKSICKLVLEKVLVDTTASLKNGVYRLAHDRSDIRFSFVAISFRSAGDIRYYFRVLGLNEDWQATSINELRFPAMPPGDYVFELYAVNKFGIRSDTIKVPFEVAYPFWRQWWFLLLVSAIVLGISWWAVSRYTARKSEEAAKELLTQKRLAELEQQALAAQMNPHFIFNCLNTIQHFFLASDRQKANRYLSMFAALVRQTLNFSSRQTVRLSEEVDYLRRYLEMEQMRFNEQFVYEIALDASVDADFVELPALLLQPYVENAIRHGLRHKTDAAGWVHIGFRLAGDLLYCRIEDNGVGRARAMSLKGRQHIEYQSKGMDLGYKRIELLNTGEFLQAARILVTDLYADDGAPAGTRVDITIPIKSV